MTSPTEGVLVMTSVCLAPLSELLSIRVVLLCLCEPQYNGQTRAKLRGVFAIDVRYNVLGYVSTV